MTLRQACITFSDFPLDPGLIDTTHTALAILTGTQGPAYRPVGAAMWLREGQIIAGSLSSGCIEQDIALQAVDCVASGQTRLLRYGDGSPFFDIRLPCGGSLDVTIVPIRSTGVIESLVQARDSGHEARLMISDQGFRETPLPDGNHLLLRIIPDVSFFVFGKGPEAVVFSELAASAGYKTRLISPDDETLSALSKPGVTPIFLQRPTYLPDLALDRYSAVTLFFHDHEWEPTILARAAASDAFYIGAQGSRTTRRSRDETLAKMGIAPDKIGAMKGPIGMFQGARDARTLAISVLAEVIAEAGCLRRESTEPKPVDVRHIRTTLQIVPLQHNTPVLTLK